jgi:hypothetical protein
MAWISHQFDSGWVHQIPSACSFSAFLIERLDKAICNKANGKTQKLDYILESPY